MASDEQRARLLHAALVKAYECEKCSWKKSECEKCSLMWHEIKGCRECLGPHYDTHRLNRTFGPPLHLLIKRVNLSDWNLIGPECSDAATEAKDCQIGEVVVNSRGRGSSHAPPILPERGAGSEQNSLAGDKGTQGSCFWAWVLRGS